MANKKQTEWVKKSLIRGRKITAIEAFMQCGCMRLASVIHKLRGRGWEINSTLLHKDGGVHFSVYNLIKKPEDDKE